MPSTRKACANRTCPNVVERGVMYCESCAATRPKRACKYKMCPELVEYGQQYCKVHRAEQEKKRGLAAERGYGRAWQKSRAAFLARHPLCEECEKAGRVTPSHHVHHRNRDTGNNRTENLAALCAECHIRLHRIGG